MITNLNKGMASVLETSRQKYVNKQYGSNKQNSKGMCRQSLTYRHIPKKHANLLASRITNEDQQLSFTNYDQSFDSSSIKFSFRNENFQRSSQKSQVQRKEDLLTNEGFKILSAFDRISTNISINPTVGEDQNLIKLQKQTSKMEKILSKFQSQSQIIHELQQYITNIQAENRKLLQQNLIQSKQITSKNSKILEIESTMKIKDKIIEKQQLKTKRQCEQQTTILTENIELHQEIMKLKQENQQLRRKENKKNSFNNEHLQEMEKFERVFFSYENFRSHSAKK